MSPSHTRTRKTRISDESLAETILNELFQSARITLARQLKPWNLRRSAQKLVAHLFKVRQVKTLWQVDKPVDLKEFYCDLHLLFDEKRVLVKGLEDLGTQNRMLITGIAGQGKSILLRYLCTSAIQDAQSIPIFIELRRILSDQSVIEHINQFLRVLGIPSIDDELVSALLDSGKITLFLDGFDEVSEAEKPKMINEIERLGLDHDRLKIIVTSRPQSGLEVSALFHVIRLSDLSKGEYQAVIRKLSENQKFADSLIKQVEANKSHLEGLLCTPLLVTLLVMSYKSFQELPEQLSEFYDSIFQVLLQRHDGVKPGFRRPRRCPFNDNQYRAVFEALCFESKHTRKSIFDYDEIAKFATVALSKNSLDADVDKYLDDIVKVTCLILREGKDHRFIHKSVQEYYAAAFIKHRPEPLAIKFYHRLLSHKHLSFWRQELDFLAEIDRYRFIKYFELPYQCSIAGCSENNIPDKPTVADIFHANRVLGEIELVIRKQNGDSLIESIGLGSSQLVYGYVEQVLRLDFRKIFDAAKEKDLPPDSTVSHTFQQTKVSSSMYSVSRILSAGVMLTEICAVAQSIIDSAHQKAQKARDFILREESMDLDVNLE